MTTRETRQFIIEALERANVVGIRSHPARTAFLEGSGDINFDQLEMDSLARMELSIAIEVSTGRELASDQLESLKSLATLAAMLDKK